MVGCTQSDHCWPSTLHSGREVNISFSLFFCFQAEKMWEECNWIEEKLAKRRSGEPNSSFKRTFCLARNTTFCVVINGKREKKENSYDLHGTTTEKEVRVKHQLSEKKLNTSLAGWRNANCLVEANRIIEPNWRNLTGTRSCCCYFLSVSSRCFTIWLSSITEATDSVCVCFPSCAQSGTSIKSSWFVSHARGWSDGGRIWRTKKT